MMTTIPSQTDSRARQTLQTNGKSRPTELISGCEKSAASESRVARVRSTDEFPQALRAQLGVFGVRE